VREPLVSIIIPTYNRASLLARAVKSARSQDYRNIEIIITDNASTDHTPILGAKLSQDHKNIIYHANVVNVGIAKNIAFALRLSRGEFVYILSDDDYLFPDSITRLLPPLLINSNICHSTSYVREVDPDGTLIKTHHYPKLAGVNHTEFLLQICDYNRKDDLAVLVYGLSRSSMLRSIYPVKEIQIWGRTTYVGTEPLILREFLEHGEIFVGTDICICYTGPGSREGTDSYSVAQSSNFSMFDAFLVYVQQFIHLFVINLFSRYSLGIQVKSTFVLIYSFTFHLTKRLMKNIILSLR